VAKEHRPLSPHKRADHSDCTPAKSVHLLFWNGQAFDEPALKPVGKFRAAQAILRDAAEIDPRVVRRWMKKAKADVFDSREFFRKLREERKRPSSEGSTA
jgi:hypothetical protein